MQHVDNAVVNCFMTKCTADECEAWLTSRQTVTIDVAIEVDGCRSNAQPSDVDDSLSLTSVLMAVVQVPLQIHLAQR